MNDNLKGNDMNEIEWEQPEQELVEAIREAADKNSKGIRTGINGDEIEKPLWAVA
jgi:hypothetical protein